MTHNDRMQLLKYQVDQKGQAQVARELGYSSTTINQTIHGSYAGSTDKVLEKVAEVYGSETVPCPLHGEISLGECADHRRRIHPGGNHMRVQQYRACKACERGKQ